MIKGLRGKLPLILGLVLAPLILIPVISFALKSPHSAPGINLCSDCHSRTGAGFATITSQNTLCINAIGCHNPGGRAEKKALSLLDASNRFGNLPSISNARQSSHGWKVPNLNPDAGVTQTDKWGELATGPHGAALNNKILCTRCHRAHGEKTGYVVHEKFLRQTPKGNYICLQCHAARQISNVRDPKPADKHYSHPVEVNYSSVSTAKPDFFYSTPQNQYSSNPSAALRLYTTVNVDQFGRVTGVKGRGQVICSTCHGPLHSADSNPYTFDNLTTYSNTGNYSTSGGNLLRRYPATKSNDLCQSCHKVQTHRSFLCSRCHTPHKKAGENNRYLIHENISTPNSGRKAVQLLSTSQMARRWQDDSTPIPVCQACHTQTRHHRNYSTASADRSHNYLGNNNYKFCAALCHKHTSSFSHGAGGGTVTDCLPCHGHDQGYKFTYNFVNYSSQGTGNRVTHSTHTENDADDQRGPNVFCDACHDTNNMPYFKTGTDTNGDGKFDLSETNVCNPCHSSAGTYNGVNSTGGSTGAKENFKAIGGDYANGGVYNSDGSLKAGKETWCFGCHDESPPTINGETAPNKMGDNSTYGFFVNGHGKVSGTYPRLAWQDSTAAGNPAANRNCAECHDSKTQHIVAGANPVNSYNTNGKRLMSANDQTNALCNICHKPTGIANAAPKWFTTISTFEKSAHGNNSKLNPLTGQPMLCTDCHDVHGPSGAYPAMTKKSNQNLCYDCHTGGKVRNDAVSGFSLASSIKQAFSLSGGKHPLGTGFVIAGKSYNLQCTSCHNVHVMTGKYWDADQNKTPITRFFNNTSPWGGANGQKMKDYAATAGGKYQKPFVSANTYNSDKLPDYASFCLDCHANAVNSIVAKDWVNNPHGKKTAGLSGMISGGGVDGFNYGGPKDCPDWKGCGRAIDWGRDRPNPGGTQNDSWPVISRGQGTNAFVHGAYNQAERNAGANYVLACTDCHEAHGSSNYKNLRVAINREYDETDIPLANDRKVLDDSPTDGTLGLCMQCHKPTDTREHSFNPGWHNNGVCASGPCHQPDPYNHTYFGNNICYGRCHSSTYVWNTDLIGDPAQWSTFHENRRLGNNNQTAAYQPGLVFHYTFENNLKDSNSWNLHGFMVNGTASYAAGKVGNALVVTDNPVEVGTEEGQWMSTVYNAGGPQGNTSKLTEMKYNTTVEAWVYPTSNPSDSKSRYVVAKHTYWDGGYTMFLYPVNGKYRAAFQANVGYGGPTSSWECDATNCNGLRGAYSTVEITPNKWTHIAATFDSQGPYANPNDQSVGKFRIYVNGVDVTTSDKTWGMQQPHDPAESTTYDEDFMTPYPIIQEKYPDRDSGWNTSVLSVAGINWSAPNDNFVGMLDEVKLWYTTQPKSYFDVIDASVAPELTSAAVSGSNRITVTFSEGVYTNTGATGALVPSDFTYTDTDNGRTITSVTHTAGSATAVLTLSSDLDTSNDIGVDTVAGAGNQIFDAQGTVAGTAAVTITGTLCPPIPATFQLNETAGSATAYDASGFMDGTVNDPAQSFVGNDGYFHGNGTDNRIVFANDDGCMRATTALTMEARIKPTNLTGTADKTYRVVSKAEVIGGANNGVYQVSVWRKNASKYVGADHATLPGNYRATDEASIAFWYRSSYSDTNRWDVLLTNYSGAATSGEKNCPIISDHWYKFRVVFDSAKSTIPGDIFVDDEGTDGAGAGELWTGYVNCTDKDQSFHHTSSDIKAMTGNTITGETGADFTIGTEAASSSQATSSLHFNGLIDWVKWQDGVDYTGVDDPPF